MALFQTIMGNNFAREFREGAAGPPETSTTPLQNSVPTFDPLLGFPNGRVPRELTVTQVLVLAMAVVVPV